MPKITKHQVDLTKVLWSDAAVMAEHAKSAKMLLEMIPPTGDEEFDAGRGTMRDALRRIVEQTADFNTLAMFLSTRAQELERS
jgi:hypothetical protein